jgi:phage shock protein PspC (stress-responsive transcriptional regulator)
MRGAAKYFRANPQVFVLFVICVVLGLGTFIAVLIALAQAGPNATPTGEPSGVIALAATLVH